MEKINVSLQILPLVGDDELYPVVDRVIEYIQKSGVKYVIGPMETTMEGSFEQCMAIVKRAHEICLEAGVPRVGSVIKTDVRKTGVTIDEKVGKYR
ncbi:MAG: MTH1187 family thiamine-binding protein [Spirochaetales bacterium]|nr:MTH1187 family thiamine-binding protein [Spirochaetales bacterium]